MKFHNSMAGACLTAGMFNCWSNDFWRDVHQFYFIGFVENEKWLGFLMKFYSLGNVGNVYSNAKRQMYTGCWMLFTGLSAGDCQVKSWCTSPGYS